MQPSSAGQDSGAGSPRLLSEFLAIPLEARAQHIQKFGVSELAETIGRLRHDGVVFPHFFERRLAWAVAFNIEGTVTAHPAPDASHHGIHAYKDRWMLDASIDDLWKLLAKPTLVSNPGHKSSLLDDLALSVLCEQNVQWQNPEAQPLDITNANQAFEYVHRTNRDKVVGYVCRQFGQGADNPEAITDEAWARVFCDYWSANARRRFLGLCRISTLVCQVARFVAMDMVREKRLFVAQDDTIDDEDGRSGFSLEKIGIVSDPTEKIAGEEVELRIRHCVGTLPPKQRIVVEMVWLREMSAKETAACLRISEPAVSQHLKKARETLRNYLRLHGFEVPA